MILSDTNLNWKVEYLGINVKMARLDYEPQKLHELYLHIQGT